MPARKGIPLYPLDGIKGVTYKFCKKYPFYGFVRCILEMVDGKSRPDSRDKYVSYRKRSKQKITRKREVSNSSLL